MYSEMKKRRIIAVTGARSEYDLLYPVYSKLAIQKDVDFQVVITGPHLSENFGYTARQVESDGFKIADQLFNLTDSSKKIGRAISVGHQVSFLAHTFNRINPDLILVAGDREEAISTTLTGAYLDLPVAHFFGGDIAKDGNIDNSVRYASSKFAHLHFAALEEHRNNLIRLGEDPWRIHVVGNPSLDRFLQTPVIDKNQLMQGLNFAVDEREPYCVLIQHPIITEVEKQKDHIRVSLEAIKKTNLKCFLNYPNSDAGNFDIREAYKEFENLYPCQFRSFKNLDRTLYVNLLRNASLLLGNSSSGLLEAPSLGLPAINIGSRQRGRTHGKNVVFVSNNEKEILDAIFFVLNNADFRVELQKKENPYGDGNSAGKICDILTSITIDNNLIHKNITY